MLKALLDTNILYSGLLFRGQENYLLMIGHYQSIRLVISEYIFDELKEVLKRNNLPVNDLLAAIDYYRIEIIQNRIVEEDPRFKIFLKESKTLINDPKDRPIYVFSKMLIKEDKDTYLVTGDKDLQTGKVRRALNNQVLRTSDLLGLI